MPKAEKAETMAMKPRKKVMMRKLVDNKKYLKNLKGILFELYGDTYQGPYVYITHKQKYELRVAKRSAKREASIDTIESLDTDSASMFGLVTPKRVR